MKWYIGCSGFSYRDWKGSFYPEKLKSSEWLTYYAEHFNTVELNVTFYRMPRLSTFEKWYDQTPDGFLFSVKAPRLVTHYKQFNEVEEVLEPFYERVETGLREKCGPVLFQTPPSFQFSEERLQRILSSVSDRFTNVLEFRHPSWWNEDVFTELTKAGILFCGQSHPSPGLPDDVIRTADPVYYRFHGVPILYRSSYSEEDLKEVREAMNDSEVAYVYFNNTWGGAALENAKFLKSLNS